MTRTGRLPTAGPQPSWLAELPPLELVRGFVAVGRRQSVTHAARELGLSQSAVSRQVQALEAALGVKLLVRTYRGLAFTEAGERLFHLAEEALRQLHGATLAARGAPHDDPVTLAASVGIASLWLMPRLPALRGRHPDIALRLLATTRQAEPRPEQAELVVRYASRAMLPARARRLFDEVLVPVAHPALGLSSLRAPTELAGVPLLDFEDPLHPWLQWEDWLQAVRWPAPASPLLRFNQYDLVVQAALAGQGVALGRLALVQPHLDSGRLLALAGAPQAPASGHSYWLVLASNRPRPAALQVADWIEAAACLPQACGA